MLYHRNKTIDKNIFIPISTKMATFFLKSRTKIRHCFLLLTNFSFSRKLTFFPANLLFSRKFTFFPRKFTFFSQIYFFPAFFRTKRANANWQLLPNSATARADAHRRRLYSLNNIQLALFFSIIRSIEFHTKFIATVFYKLIRYINYLSKKKSVKKSLFWSLNTRSTKKSVKNHCLWQWLLIPPKHQWKNHCFYHRL